MLPLRNSMSRGNGVNWLRFHCSFENSQSCLLFEIPTASVYRVNLKPLYGKEVMTLKSTRTVWCPYPFSFTFVCHCECANNVLLLRFWVSPNNPYYIHHVSPLMLFMVTIYSKTTIITQWCVTMGQAVAMVFTLMWESWLWITMHCCGTHDSCFIVLVPNVMHL